MLPDYAFLGSFIEDLYRISSLWKRFEVYSEYLQRLGFDGATYTYIPALQLELPHLAPVFLSTPSYPTAFLQHYQAERLDQLDFSIRKMRSHDLAPMDWREHEVKGWINADERSVIVLARDSYGIKNGISIPTMLSEAGGAGMSIISRERDEVFKKLKKEHLNTLIRCTKLFHDVNYASSDLAQAFILPLLASLKPKEVEVLRYLASGRPFKTIEDSTGISYRYASNLMNELRNRLGGMTKDKLMYMVGLLNIAEHA